MYLKIIKSNCVIIVAAIISLSILLFQPGYAAVAPENTAQPVTAPSPTQSEIRKKPSAVDFWPAYPAPVAKSDVSAKLITRGEYLAKMGDCIACHTNVPANGKPFAGGLPIKTPFGTFFTPNITPDKETGIGNWSDEDFIRAMHQGINPNGEYYFPVFPYTSFTKVSDQDLIAIKAYLDAIPAVNQKNKATTAIWPFSWRFSQLFWRTLFFRQGYYQYDAEKSPEWNRGAYIVQGLGHCGECHTPRNFMGAMKTKYYLTGAFIDDFWAPDITGQGLEHAHEQQVLSVFTKDELIEKAGPVRGPMAEVDHDSLQYMKEADLAAIATYLKTIKSSRPRAPQISKKEAAALKSAGQKLQFDPETLQVGQKVYDKVCSICHNAGMAGAPKIYSSASWAPRIKQGVDVLYNHAIHGFNQMPPKGACVTCKDDEIKAAVDYIISNSQEPVELKGVAGAEYKPADTSLQLGKQVYEKVCSVCHADGRLGAPKLGDKAAWDPLLKKNFDGLVLATLRGVGNMPAMGGCKECKNSEIIAAVKYMVQQSNPNGDYSLW